MVCAVLARRKGKYTLIDVRAVQWQAKWFTVTTNPV